MHIILEHINDEIHRNYLRRYNNMNYYFSGYMWTHMVNEYHDLYKQIYDEILDYIQQKYSKIFEFEYNKLCKNNKYIEKLTSDQNDFNRNLCYELYYKKYADILWKNISEIINKVFKK